jgi:hypothetical protein
MAKCLICNGSGVVNWSSRYSSKEPQSGEIRVEEISVCGMCSGTGMKKRGLIQMLDMSVEEYHEKFGG